MRITDIRATPVAVPSYHAGDAIKKGDNSNPLISVIVEVITDDGYVGVGESPAMLGAALTAEIIESSKPILMGKDPSQINMLLKSLYVRYNLARLHIHLASWAFSGIELALWDIAAKSADMPLYQLWGGAFRDCVDIIGFIERQDLSKMAEDARDLASKGFHTLYTDIGTNPEDDIAAMEAMRKGAPDPYIKLCGDANQAWSTGIAVNTINRMEPLGIGWIEQPVIMYNLDGLKDVKSRVNVPILGHESNWTMYDLLNVIKMNCVDYVKLDARFDAGYYGARVSAGIAEAAGIQCAHNSFPQLGVALAGSLHVIASIPNFSLPYSMYGYKGVDDVITGGSIYSGNNSYINIPQKPGIGISLDPERLLKYNELYFKEVLEKDQEWIGNCATRDAMYMRKYFEGNVN